MGDRQVAAGREGVEQPGHDRIGIGALLRIEVHEDGDQHQRHRLVEVEGGTDLGAGQDGVRVAEVGQRERRAALRGAGHQRARVREHQRIVVRVEHAGVRMDRLRHLVDVGGRRDPGTDVEELADPDLAREVADGTVEERPVGPRHRADRRDPLSDHVAQCPVRRVVVLATQPVVVHARLVRHSGVDLRRIRVRHWAGSFTCGLTGV
jgi:hypothetical protein